jgi:hypothetical protein
MKTQLVFLITLLLLSLTSLSQTTISGVVKDNHDVPIIGVNVYVEGTYDGASSDVNGQFHFTTTEKGQRKLMASFIGYKTWEKLVDLSNPVKEEIILRESVNTLDAVTITAGTFAASDEKRASILQPLDIYSTAGSNADIMAAMKTMPGTQSSPDDGRLMVRGGDAYESKTYIDGLIAAQPYYSKTPDVATRGRFSPSLFSGVQFNSGGYSAEYGQALSSILNLNSTDVATSDVTGLSLMTIGAEGNLTKAFRNSSIMASGSYTNMWPYHKIFPSKLTWTKPVESFGINLAHRYKPSSESIWKNYFYADFGNMSYTTTESDKSTFSLSNKNRSFYYNTVYKNCISEKDCYRVGISSTYESNSTHLNGAPIDTREISAEGRAIFFHQFSEGVNLNLGVNETFSLYNQEVYTVNNDKTWDITLTDHTMGLFAESEIKFSKYFAIKPGIRTEYGTLLRKASLSPRFSLALKTGKNSQLSGAWGLYYQNPEFNYLKFNSKLNLEKATHYILSFQSGSVDNQLFRTEVYYKTYNHLITWEGNNEYYPQNIANDGKGYARGIDIFWRDKKSIRNIDYWVTYSFIDTKRLYKNYPEMATPDFISAHNFSFVSKYWINSISTQVGMSFNASSGRNYDDPSTPEFMDVKTGWYNNLSLNISKIFFIGNQYSVLFFSVSNILGSDPVVAYRPTSAASSNGDYQLTPVKQDMKRFFFLGLFLNFDGK